MASQEHLARNRARMLDAIIQSLQAVARDGAVQLPPVPALNRLQDSAHREFALIRWVHDAFVLVGLLGEPVYPEPQPKPAAITTPATPTTPPAGDLPSSPTAEELQKLTKEQLLALATERKIEGLKASNTKADIIAALTTPATPTTP